jgi:hypothetical protein
LIVGGIVVDEAAGFTRSSRWIELVADTEIERQLARGLPLVGHEEEEPGLAIAREGAVGVLSDLIGRVEEDAGDIVGLAGCGAAEGCGFWRRGLVFTEIEGSGSSVVVAL